MSSQEMLCLSHLPLGIILGGEGGLTINSLLTTFPYEEFRVTQRSFCGYNACSTEERSYTSQELEPNLVPYNPR